MAVAHDGSNASHRRQLIRSTLRIATRHHNPCLGVLPVCAADECFRGSVRFGGHTARVYHYHVCRRRIAVCQAGGAQMTAYRFAIGARRTAAEMFNMKLRHIFSVLPG